MFFVDGFSPSFSGSGVDNLTPFSSIDFIDQETKNY